MVSGLEAEPELADLAKTLSDELLIRADDGEREVIGRSELELLMQHQRDKQLAGCEGNQACLAQIAVAAKGEHLLTGRLGRLGGSYLVTLHLLDAQRGAVLRSASDAVDNEGDLIAATGALLKGLLGGSAPAAAKHLEIAKGAKAAVMRFDAHGVDDGIAQSLTDLLAIELRKLAAMSVISRSEIKALLELEGQRQMLQCDDEQSCLIEVGGALGVDFLVSGGIGKLGDAYVLSLKLIDVNGAKVARRAVESFRGPVSDLASPLRYAARSLVGHSPDGGGDLTLTINASPAQVVIDGSRTVEWPTEGPIRLPAGKHTLTVTADDHLPLARDTYVEPNARADLQLMLEAVSEPWYAKWYTWVIIGVAIGGGAAAGVALAPRAPEDGTVSVTVP